MGKRKTTPSIQLVPHRYTSAILFLTLAIGIVGSLAFGIYTANQVQNTLQRRAQDISRSISADLVSGLSGSTADIDTPAFIGLQTALSDIKANSPDIQSLSIIGKSDSTIFTYVSSGSLDSDEFIAPGSPIPTPSSHLQTLDIGKTAFSERAKDANGNSVLTGLSPILDDSGDFVGAVRISMHVSQYYTTIAKYAVLPLFLISFPIVAIILDRHSQRKQEEAMRLKSQFVSVASHELRSPLSGILWAVQSLLKPTVKNLTIEQQVILLDMYQSAEESLATINEILDMSAFERDKPQRQSKQRVELGAVIKTAAKTLRLSANERGIKFVYVGNWDSDDTYVIGDPNSLRRMFMNLIANAIKYGRDNSEISIRLVKKDSHFVVAIEDQGIGIPQSDQKRVLEGYYRAQNAQDTQRAGTGLGLLLAKLVAEQHGGRLWLTSKEGRGTTVYVSIPDESTKQPSS